MQEESKFKVIFGYIFKVSLGYLRLCLKKKKIKISKATMPLIPVPERQRQADLCEFKVSLVYKESSR